MKKFLICLSLLALVLVSCGDKDARIEEQRLYHQQIVKDHSELIELTFGDDTHQYVLTTFNEWNITHWAGCKYCKQKDTEPKSMYDYYMR